MDLWADSRVRRVAELTIQDLGSIGELIAAVATIATLVYLAIQIRANTSAMRAESRRSSNTQAQNYSAAIGTSKEAASVLRRGLGDFDSLDPDEKTQFQFLLSMIVSQADNASVEFELGITDRAMFDTNISASLRMLATSGGRRYWELNSSTYSPDFQSLVERELSG